MAMGKPSEPIGAWKRTPLFPLHWSLAVCACVRSPSRVWPCRVDAPHTVTGSSPSHAHCLQHLLPSPRRRRPAPILPQPPPPCRRPPANFCTHPDMYRAPYVVGGGSDAHANPNKRARVISSGWVPRPRLWLGTGATWRCLPRVMPRVGTRLPRAAADGWGLRRPRGRRAALHERASAGPAPRPAAWHGCSSAPRAPSDPVDAGPWTPGRVRGAQPSARPPNMPPQVRSSRERLVRGATSLHACRGDAVLKEGNAPARGLFGGCFGRRGLDVKARVLMRCSASAAMAGAVNGARRPHPPPKHGSDRRQLAVARRSAKPRGRPGELGVDDRRAPRRGWRRRQHAAGGALGLHQHPAPDLWCGIMRPACPTWKA